MRSKKSMRVKKSTRATKVVRVRKSTRSAKSARAEKPVRAEKSTSSEKPTRAEKRAPFISALGAWVLVICVMTAALLVAGRPSFERAGVATPDVARETADVPREIVDIPREDVAVPVQPAAAASKPASRTLAAFTPVTATTATATTPAEKPTPLTDAIENGPSAEPAVTASVEETALVTMTGCLEADNKTFRLKDTAGADVPRSRSWRTGFLKKRSASIAVVDAAGRVSLSTHVGQRVAVTGRLADHQMQVRSLQSVAASCSQKADVALTADLSSP